MVSQIWCSVLSSSAAAVPDCANRFTCGIGPLIGAGGKATSGDIGGSENVLLNSRVERPGCFCF
jgi:hypothetical protein